MIGVPGAAGPGIGPCMTQQLIMVNTCVPDESSFINSSYIHNISDVALKTNF